MEIKSLKGLLQKKTKRHLILHMSHINYLTKKVKC